MSLIRQYHGGSGVPLRIDEPLDAPAAAWRSQRARLRAWLDALPDEAWTGETRCAEWDVTLLARHLASGAMFLGYTLHKAAGGTATTALAGFDTHATVQAAAAMLGDLTPEEARAAVAGADPSVDAQLADLDPDGWLAMAEAPTGNVPAYLSISHFLFDSWVHEYDLLLPRGERPPLVASEAVPSVAYVLGIAALAGDAPASVDVRLTDLGLVVGVSVVDGFATVTPGEACGAPVVEGAVVDVMDLATGRGSDTVVGDPAGLAVLDELAVRLAS